MNTNLRKERGKNMRYVRYVEFKRSPLYRLHNTFTVCTNHDLKI